MGSHRVLTEGQRLDLASLGALVAARARLDREIDERVAALRADNVPWGRIADELGITRQATWERYGATG